ncbi:hypothetical protein AB205_0059550, partial [Aquarana catesbeiana]
MTATQFGSGGSQPPAPTVSWSGGCGVPSRSAGNRAECYQPLPSTGNNDTGRRGSRPPSPTEGLATGPSTAGLCPQLTEDGFPVKVDGTSDSGCIPQGCWAVGPDPQKHDGVSQDTLSSLQRQKGLQGEGPVQASPQRQISSLREAEVGWVSNALFGTICLGYCVGRGIGGLELLTNFGVNPSGVSSCVSLLPKGEKCDRPSRERDFWRGLNASLLPII